MSTKRGATQASQSRVNERALLARGEGRCRFLHSVGTTAAWAAIFTATPFGAMQAMAQDKVSDFNPRSQDMTIENNKALVRRFYEAVEREDYEEVAKLCHKDFVFYTQLDTP